MFAFHIFMENELCPKVTIISSSVTN